MNPELIKKALEALANGDAEAAMAVLGEMIADAASGTPESEPEGDPAAMAEGDAPANEDEDEDEKEMMAAARTAMALTGLDSPGAAIAELTRRSRVATDVEAREKKIAADRRALEADERDAHMVARIVARKIDPGMVWADPLVATDRSKRKLAPPWDTMPIEQMRAQTEALGLKLGEPAPAPNTPRPPSGDTEATKLGLTDHELAQCRSRNIDPAKYAATRAAIKARSSNAQRAEV